MDPLTQLDELIALFDRLLPEIDDAQLGSPTACSDFDVDGVLTHMVGGATMFAAAYRGAEPAPPLAGRSIDVLGPTLAELRSAMRAPGALDRTIQAPFGAVPGDVFARFVVLDGLVHGWDLTTATGASYEPSDDLVAAVHGFAETALPPLHGSDAFGMPVDPGPDATPIERLVALTGRDPDFAS